MTVGLSTCWNSFRSTAPCCPKWRVAVCFMYERAAAMLLSTEGQPILFQFSMDCTPGKSTVTLTNTRQGRRMRKAVKRTSEFCVQQQFLTVPNVMGELQHTVLFRDPIILAHGKTMPALAGCALACPGISLQTAERNRVHVRHRIHDRGITKGLYGLLSGFWHSADSHPFELQHACRMCSSRRPQCVEAGLVRRRAAAGEPLHLHYCAARQFCLRDGRALIMDLG